MMRAGIWLKAMRATVIALMGLLIVPLAIADDLSFLFPSENLSTVLVKTYETMEDEDADSHDCCPCMICTEGIVEHSIAVHPPEAGALLASVSPDFRSSLYRPEILRPPIC